MNRNGCRASAPLAAVIVNSLDTIEGCYVCLHTMFLGCLCVRFGVHLLDDDRLFAPIGP